MTELKRCPFCGGIPEMRSAFVQGIANHKNYFLSCSVCGFRLRNRRGIDGANIDWNTRPIEDELRKSNARLGAGLDECLAFLNHLAEEYPSIRAHATRFERVRRLIEFPYQPKGECRWRDTALQISKLHGEAEADAERLANEYTKTLKEIGGVYWEEPEEISPALILHKMRKGR
jgi:hypothetical protein